MPRQTTAERSGSCKVLAAARPEDHAADPAALLGNPLRGLTPANAATLIGAAMRGEWTRVQWLMYYVEQWDPDVWTVVERRTAGLKQLDWTIRTDATAKAHGLETLAAAQKSLLHGWYSQILNMREAVEFLAMAKFRGYSHLCPDTGLLATARRLQPIDQWWWVRDGMFGGWYYNPTARATRFESLGEPVDESQWIIRSEPRSLLWLAIAKFLRAQYGQHWWDAYCEEAARQGTVIIGPPGMTPEQQTAFETAALNIARSGSGVVANGSDVKRTGVQAAAVQATVWEQRLRFIEEQFILAGTGGLLTALSQVGGSGGSQAGEHGSIWRSLLRADAGAVSEVFQAQVDRRLLGAEFPGAPVLAWFELDASEAPSTDAVIGQAVALFQAGYAVSAAQISERTGYKLVDDPDRGRAAPPALLPAAALANRGREGAGGIVAQARRPAGSPRGNRPMGRGGLPLQPGRAVVVDMAAPGMRDSRAVASGAEGSL